MQWETVIGLEIHTQLATKSKIFSGAATNFGAEPNTQACVIDLGLPGVLPVLNIQAVQLALRFGRAIGAEIAKRSIFARKNYFYPDLPKGYQISQYENPIIGRGQIEILLENGMRKKIGITRAHLEEDTGKSLHEDLQSFTGIDLNRAGVPLLEIVSEPDLRSPQETVAYAKKIHQIICYLEVSDGNLQEGSFRMDANVSIRPAGQKTLGTRTELKNLNSFRFLEKALQFEINRQIDVIRDGGRVIQETRLYDPNQDETRSMRTKEEANDYRYFPDPDLLPLIIDEKLLIATNDLPELPDAKQVRFQNEYGLTEYDANILTATRALADYFETVARTCAAPKLTANWIQGDLLGALNRAGLEIQQSPISANQLAGLLQRLQDQSLSGKLAKQVFEGLWNQEGDADQIITQRNLHQLIDINALESLISTILAAHPTQVAQYQAGKTQVLGFLVGQIMKKSAGKANPQQVNEILLRQLQNL